METKQITPIVAGSMILPFLRPLPVIFGYIRRLNDSSQPIARAKFFNDEFHSHLNCLAQTVKATAQEIDSAKSDVIAILQKIQNLAFAEPDDLVDKVNDLELELARFSEKHKSSLRDLYQMKPSMFRSIYHQSVRIRKLALVYHGAITKKIQSIFENLTERCYYDVTTVREAYVRSKMERFDLVVFAPSDREISNRAIDCVREAQIPLLVLIDLGGKNEERNLCQTRLAGLYRKNGIDVLIRPFPAIRLFQKIDKVHIDNIVHAPRGLPVFEIESEEVTYTEPIRITEKVESIEVAQ